MKKLLQVLCGEPSEIPPIWLMRQAGRYLPEYRATRTKAGSFLDLCYSPELAAEVTLQPLRRFDFDAAILFADILLIADALGQEVSFVEGKGPVLSPPIRRREDLTCLRPSGEIHERLAPVYETVRLVREAIPGHVALIGFAGAPWTVATYMAAGGGSSDQAAAREWMYRDPEGFGALIDLLTEATLEYLDRQIAAGAEVIKIFDTWAGVLPAERFDRYVTQPTRRIVEALGERWPDVPVIGFPRCSGANYLTFAAETGVAGVALDTSVPLSWARTHLVEAAGGRLVLQGNLDPMLLVTGGEALKEAVRGMVREMTGVPYIVNAGHGITPDADPENVATLVRVVREGI